jgi:hypothetical protein
MARRKSPQYEDHLIGALHATGSLRFLSKLPQILPAWMVAVREDDHDTNDLKGGR